MPTTPKKASPKKEARKRYKAGVKFAAGVSPQIGGILTQQLLTIPFSPNTRPPGRGPFTLSDQNRLVLRIQAMEKIVSWDSRAVRELAEGKHADRFASLLERTANHLAKVHHRLLRMVNAEVGL